MAVVAEAPAPKAEPAAGVAAVPVAPAADKPVAPTAAAVVAAAAAAAPAPAPVKVAAGAAAKAASDEVLQTASVPEDTYQFKYSFSCTVKVSPGSKPSVEDLSCTQVDSS